MICPVPDTNVLLHARKLGSLPWGDIEVDDVEIILVGPTLREIDKHKTRSGRVGKRAREVSAEIRDILKMPGRTRVLREASPRVTVTVVPGIGLHQALHDSLDLDHPDHALVNHGLALVQAGRPARLLTNDTLASLVAEEVGLPVTLLPDSWLLEAEADETEKRLKRALGEIEELKRQEPQIRAGFVSGDEEPIDRLKVEIKRYPALEYHEIETLVERAQSLCPAATSFGPTTAEEALEEEKQRRRSGPFSKYATMPVLPSMLKKVFQPASAQAIAKYQTEAYPDWLADVRKSLETMHERLFRSIEWPSFTLALRNDGTRPAEGALVEVSARGSFLLRRPSPPPEGAPAPRPWLPAPPKPPRGGLFERSPFNQLHDLSASMKWIDDPIRAGDVLAGLAPPDPTKWIWRPKRGEVASSITAKCSQWRHQSSMPPSVILVESHHSEGNMRGAVDLKIYAHNVSKPVAMTLPVEICIVGGDTLRLANALIDDLPKQDRAAHPLDRSRRA